MSTALDTLQALTERLSQCIGDGFDSNENIAAYEAGVALIEQMQRAQPVGKLIRGEGGAFRYSFGDDLLAVYALPPGEHSLYATQQPESRKEPLTSHEILLALTRAGIGGACTFDHELAVARVVEAAHGIQSAPSCEDADNGSHGKDRPDAPSVRQEDL
jgi:hypothetical protein